MVPRPILLLCGLHIRYICCQHYDYIARDTLGELNSCISLHFADQQTMRRLRELSRYDCDVRVLRNRFCQFFVYSITMYAYHVQGAT